MYGKKKKIGTIAFSWIISLVMILSTLSMPVFNVSAYAEEFELQEFQEVSDDVETLEEVVTSGEDEALEVVDQNQETLVEEETSDEVEEILDEEIEAVISEPQMNEEAAQPQKANYYWDADPETGIVGWYKNAEASSPDAVKMDSTPVPAPGSFVTINAAPDAECGAWLENLSGNLNWVITVFVDCTVKIGKESNAENLSIDTLNAYQGNVYCYGSVSGTLRIGAPTIEIAGNVETIFVGESYFDQYGDVLIKGNVGKVELAKQSVDDDSKKYGFWGDFKVLGTVTKATVEEYVYNSVLGRYGWKTIYTVENCPVGVFKIVNGEMDGNIPLVEFVPENDNEYDYSYQCSGRDGKTWWHKQAYDKETGRLVYGEDCSIEDVDGTANIYIYSVAAEDPVVLGFDCELVSVYLEGDSDEIGKVTINGNVDTLMLKGYREAWDVTVTGNVKSLGMNYYPNSNHYLYIKGTTTWASFYNEALDAFIGWSRDVSDMEFMKAGDWNKNLFIMTSRFADDAPLFNPVSENEKRQALATEGVGEKEIVATGTSPVTVMKDADVAVNNINIISSEDKELVSDLVADEESNIPADSHIVSEVNIDISTYYRNVDTNKLYVADGYEKTNIIETDEEIKLTLLLPESVYDEEANYTVVRKHVDENGELQVDVLDIEQDGSKISFASDKFSTFMVLSDEEVEEIDLSGTISFNVDTTKATTAFKSGATKPSGSTQYIVDGKSDVKVSVVPKTGQKVSSVYAVAGDGQTDGGMLVQAFPLSPDTVANVYVLKAEDIYKMLSSKGAVTILAYVEAVDCTVKLPEEDVKITIINPEDSEFEPTVAGSEVNVKYGETLYFTVDVADAVHKVLGTVSKVSGTATLTKVSSAEGVYYKLAGVKSNVTIKATTSLTKAEGGAEFAITGLDSSGVTKVAVTGATLNGNTNCYVVKRGVTEVAVTVTANAPFVPALNGEVVSPKAVSGKIYTYTFKIPAVDIVKAEDEGIAIPEFKVTTSGKRLTLSCEYDDESVILESISEDTTGLYTATKQWTVPFGTTVSFTVKAKDNCKLLYAVVNGKKVTIGKNGKVTFKASDLEDDTFEIYAEKLLKTVVVENEDDIIAGSKNTFKLLKQNVYFLCIQEGSIFDIDHMLNLEDKEITAKIGKQDVEYDLLSNDNKSYAMVFMDLDNIAGKTISVTIKDGKKTISSAKLAVSAKATKAKIKGEKKIDGVDTIVADLDVVALNKAPKFKVTYDTGVNPSDIVIRYKNPLTEENDVKAINGVIDSYDLSFWKIGEEFVKSLDIQFVDVTQFDENNKPLVIAEKRLLFTLNKYEKLAPTVKVLSTSDTAVRLSVKSPSLPEGYTLSYVAECTQVVGKGKTADEEMYNNITVDLHEGINVIKLTDLEAGSGKACNYAFKVKGSYDAAPNVKCKEVTVKGATKVPAYEKALKLVGKKVKFYAGEGSVNVATVKFSAATTHTENIKANVSIIFNGEVVPIASTEGDNPRIVIDEDTFDVYVDFSGYPAGIYEIQVQAAAPEGENGSIAKMKFTVLEPINKINIKYASTETVEVNGKTYPVFRVADGKGLAKTPTVDFGTGNVPAAKKLLWSIVFAKDGNDKDFKGISIDANTGKLTVNPNYNVNEPVQVTVRALANDYANNGVGAEYTVLLMPKCDFELEVIEDGKVVDLNVFNVGEISWENEIRVVPKNAVAGAKYTYYTDCEGVSIDENGVVTVDAEKDNIGYVTVTVIEKKGTIKKVSKISISQSEYVYY